MSVDGVASKEMLDFMSYERRRVLVSPQVAKFAEHAEWST